MMAQVLCEICGAMLSGQEIEDGEMLDSYLCGRCLEAADTARTGMGATKPAVPDKTDLDDDIREALDDAVSDGEGRLSAYYVRHHLAKRGLKIISSAQHAPTPWSTNGRYIYSADRWAILDAGYGVVAAPDTAGMTPAQCATAEFIVRAANCHDELVAALQGLADAEDEVTASYHEGHQGDLAINRLIAAHQKARAALAKAGTP